jgi:hypothetical protein
MRIAYLLVILAGVLLLVPTCKQIAEKASEKVAEKMIEQSSGGKAKVDLNSKDGSMKVTSNDGKTQTQWGQGASMPEGWPSWLGQYPGSTVQMANRQVLTDKVSLTATLQTKDAPELIVKFYEDKATAQGMKSNMKMSMPQNGSMQSFTKDDQILTVTCVTNTDGNTISLIYEFKPKKAG